MVYEVRLLTSISGYRLLIERSTEIREEFVLVVHMTNQKNSEFVKGHIQSMSTD